MFITEGVDIPFRSAKNLLGIHTPTVEDVSYIFHSGVFKIQMEYQLNAYLPIYNCHTKWGADMDPNSQNVE